MLREEMIKATGKILKDAKLEDIEERLKNVNADDLLMVSIFHELCGIHHQLAKLTAMASQPLPKSMLIDPKKLHV